jgi:hypothetical protein
MLPSFPIDISISMASMAIYLNGRVTCGDSGPSEPIPRSAGFVSLVHSYSGGAILICQRLSPVCCSLILASSRPFVCRGSWPAGLRRDGVPDVFDSRLKSRLNRLVYSIFRIEIRHQIGQYCQMILNRHDGPLSLPRLFPHWEQSRQ